MTTEFNDSEGVVGSEFAEVSVRFDTTGNAPRLRLEDLHSGRVRYLDALELENESAQHGIAEIRGRKLGYSFGYS